MPKYLKLSGRKSKTFVLERGVNFFTQQATATPCISCYRSPIRDQINFFQKNLWSRCIERSDESLHTVNNDRPLFRKSITSLVVTSWLMAQYKTYGKRSRARALLMQIRCKWAETTAMREIVLPCLSLPEWVWLFPAFQPTVLYTRALTTRPPLQICQFYRPYLYTISPMFIYTQPS